jgi:hypothetical protein
MAYGDPYRPHDWTADHEFCRACGMSYVDFCLAPRSCVLRACPGSLSPVNTIKSPANDQLNAGDGIALVSTSHPGWKP